VWLLGCFVWLLVVARVKYCCYAASRVFCVVARVFCVVARVFCMAVGSC